MIDAEKGKRTQKIQLMLADEEVDVIDTWRFENRMPSRAAAIRELISRGLYTGGFHQPTAGKPSGAFGVLSRPDED